MLSKKPIPAAERRRQDYLRRKTLKVGSVYGSRLAKARRAELRRVLALARDLDDPEALAPLLELSLDESGCLPGWWEGLWLTAGVPIARSTAATLRQAKAAGEEDVWKASLRRYAVTRAGNEIVTVTGTWKRSLVALLRAYLAEDLTGGIEALTRKLYRGYLATLEKWQCRRIVRSK